jgi:hypothetical protein
MIRIIAEARLDSTSDEVCREMAYMTILEEVEDMTREKIIQEFELITGDKVQ